MMEPGKRRAMVEAVKAAIDESYHGIPVYADGVLCGHAWPVGVTIPESQPAKDVVEVCIAFDFVVDCPRESQQEIPGLAGCEADVSEPAGSPPARQAAPGYSFCPHCCENPCACGYMEMSPEDQAAYDRADAAEQAVWDRINFEDEPDPAACFAKLQERDPASAELIKMAVESKENEYGNDQAADSRVQGVPEKTAE